jgi:hypothetical protein
MSYDAQLNWTYAVPTVYDLERQGENNGTPTKKRYQRC